MAGHLRKNEVKTMSIRIITDSAADIPQNYDEKILVLPLHISFGEEEYLDGVNLSYTEFYEKLIESDELPRTSQLPPFEFEEAYRNVTEAGDTAIVITLAGKLSGTYQSACMAAEKYEGKVHVVDSESVTVGQRALITYARQLIDRDLSPEEIVAELNSAKRKIQVVALLDTLEYLKKGGRIPETVAAFGEMLSIKPVVSLERGEVVILGKAHGSKNGNNLLMKRIREVGGIDYDMPYFLGYTGLSDKLLQKYIKDSSVLWEGLVDELPISTVGGTIGTHVGPGAIAVAFFAKENS